MTIDFWGLGLQAINVLILVWLLSRVFWRPVAAAIARRQETAQAVMETAQAKQDEANAALAEVTKARGGIKAERAAVLDAARAEAETAAKATLASAQADAEKLRAAAKASIDKQTLSAQKANAVEAADLSLKIAGKLLERLNGPAVHAAFLAQLVDTITQMPSTDRAALLDAQSDIEIVTAQDASAERDNIVKAVHKALGSKPDVRFVVEPALLGGLELRSAHFVLRNSWQADLMQVQKVVTDAT
ncbi:ATP synthase F0 subunit B [Sulfitobacter sp.]|uniref:ATP synthase F0 subunit B n=1 Tax=Sulfitobacter sp. TaxID=1903071 RepID=UPI00300399CF